MPNLGATVTAHNSAIDLARELGLHPNAKSHHAHICALCKHTSSGHLLVDDGDFRAGPYRCSCGCDIPQASPGFWLSERDYDRWKGACPNGDAMTHAPGEWADDDELREHLAETHGVRLPDAERAVLDDFHADAHAADDPSQPSTA